VTPCLGFALREIPLNPPEFAAGLALFAAVPTTLGVGVSLVRSCAGNEGLALLLTGGCCLCALCVSSAPVAPPLLRHLARCGLHRALPLPLPPRAVASNILGIFTMPLWLKALLGGSSQLESVSVDIPNLLARLSITILAPSVAGKLVRELPPLGRHVKRFTAAWKTPLSMFSVVMLSMIVWQSLSGSQATLMDQQFVQVGLGRVACAARLCAGERVRRPRTRVACPKPPTGMCCTAHVCQRFPPLHPSPPPLQTLYVILLAIGQHLVYLAFNFAALHYVFHMPLTDLIATGIMSSQKSAPVAVTGGAQPGAASCS
jgi:hypothetical protein